jgi:hypothetical protein
MAKYSQKIQHFLNGINPSIKSSNSPFDNTSIKNIYNSVLEAQKTNYDIKITNKTCIKMIHTRDDYPLSYIFFKCLYETELLNRIISYPPNIIDLHTFMDWHRENIEHVNLDAIHKIMDELDDADIYEELKNVYTLIFKSTGIRKILHDSIYNNKFISVDVQYDLESVDLEYVEYIINDRHKINVFVPNGKDHPDLKKVATTITMMENITKIYNDTKNIPSVNLTIIFSDQKKNVYHWTDVLCCDNINSGSTYPGISIICWRREEFQKVLIHELVHYYNFDFFSTDNYYHQLNNMIQIPKIIGSDMLNECYTESCTIMILIIFRFLMMNNQISGQNKENILNKYDYEDNQNNYNEFNNYFNKYLKIEISFSMFQLGKIISIFGGDSFQDLVTGKIIIKQNTSFRSYFLIKLILLCNTNEFLNIMNESIMIANDRLIDFGNLINKSWVNFLKNKHNINIINTFIKQIKNAFENDDDRWIFNTCRMSVNDIV